MNGHIVHRLEPQPEPSADLSPPTSATSARASMSRWVGAQPRWAFARGADAPLELEEVPMPIVGGLDIHRKQLTFDYLDTATGEVERGQVAPADRAHLRAWLSRFAGREDVAFAL